ncbi:MAG: HAD family hydrolase [SAR202 cluster bacterium]|jgi:putative hydrolase of the HAD superfamily|nr:HAD family hydrolase [SAR202 cluster bacterium]MDP6715797.1 HAD family hydrolase [SAR202 cluster bacterium]
MSKLPKAMLIDLDDTILAYDKLSRPIWLSVCQNHAEELPNVTPEQLVEAIDEYRKWYWSDPTRHRRARLNLGNVRGDVVEGGFERLGIKAAELALKMGNEYAKRREQAVAPFPGAIDALVALKDLGMRMAMVTNGSSETQRAKINRWDLEQYFDFILVEGEFGKGKPEPDVYRHAMKTLDSQPSNTWMVGDNLEWEVAAPQRMGITGVWHDWRGRGLPKGASIKPDRIITSLQELLQLPLE